MIDGGERTTKLSPCQPVKLTTYDNIKELSDLPKIEVQRLNLSSACTKICRKGRKKVELNGFNDAATAKQRDQTGLGCLEREKPQQ